MPTPVPDPRRIAVVRGEGVGPAVIEAALAVLEAARERFAFAVDIDESLELSSRDEFGLALDEAARASYQSWFDAGVPVLHGPAGGRFVYRLRDEFGLAIKLTPIRPSAAVADAAIVQDARRRGADILIVRDNSAGLYQGRFGWSDDGATAFHEASYTRGQVERVLRRAAELARQRDGRLTVVTKPGGIPTISALWREVALETAHDLAALEFVEIDNACYQIVADPRRFDVVVTPNMFGDVVGDTATVLLGSRGLAYSANFGEHGRAVYQTAHGAAHDLAGTDTANPVAQLLTLTWLLRDRFGLVDPADAIEGAIEAVLASGYRTFDIASGSSTIVGTAELAARIATRVASDS